jgi:hypothetical protein
MNATDQAQAEEFAAWLLDVGDGIANDPVESTTVQLPQSNV